MELELKSEKENAEIRIEKPEDYQEIIDAEWNIIYEKLHKIVDSGTTPLYIRCSNSFIQTAGGRFSDPILRGP